MSGFSAHWLSLREPIDAASRHSELITLLSAWRQRRGVLSVLDLGSGTGANFRCLARHLGGEQHWRLIDDDVELLAQVDGKIRQWAVAQGMRITNKGSALVLHEPQGCYRLESLCLNLASELDRLDFEEVKLVTASALIDLVSSHWLDNLSLRCWEQKAAVFITLSYDGTVVWEPGEQADETLRYQLNRHQCTDKGFGTALGPEAPHYLAAGLERLGYRIALKPSPWGLGPEHAALQTALLDGWVAAAQQMAPDLDRLLEDWLVRRRKWINLGHSRLYVGHLDLFASLDPIQSQWVSATQPTVKQHIFPHRIAAVAGTQALRQVLNGGKDNAWAARADDQRGNRHLQVIQQTLFQKARYSHTTAFHENPKETACMQLF
jgi:hypothetical protein